MAVVKSDIEIARAATKKPVFEIGAKIGIAPEHLVPYGHDKQNSRRNSFAQSAAQGMASSFW